MHRKIAFWPSKWYYNNFQGDEFFKFYIFQCAEKNCKIVEFDVTKTADGVPIVFHDNSIDRLTGRKGIIEDMLWSDVSKLDISVNHPLR